VIAAVVVLAGALVAWGQLRDVGSSHAVAWRDITAELGPIRYPHSTIRHFSVEANIRKYLRQAMPSGAPVAPPIPPGDEIILVGAGPRSSSGYGVKIVSVVDHPRRVVVTAREITPTFGQHVVPGLTFPYRLILIHRIKKSVSLVWLGRP